jgi:spore photoproduct lyase
MASYCYVGRFNHDKVYINENTDQILMSIDQWVEAQPWPKVPNQCDPEYYTIDIGCSTDVALHHKQYDWQRVFTFFNAHPKLKTTFATKYPTKFPLTYDLSPGKHRLRVSLMPQKISDVLEPGTDKIIDRINMIPVLQEHLEVHINFSPIVYYKGWLTDYRELFEQVKAAGVQVSSECIFLTYNNIQHERNSDAVNELCWMPQFQEAKDSQYAADNIRYQYQLKAQLVQKFKTLYAEYFPIESIRYIF